MFNPSRTVIDNFVHQVVGEFGRAFPNETAYERLLEQSARIALETLVGADAPYHNMEHSILATDVAQSILWGRLISQGDVSAHDWVHSIVATLYHDIGFIRGLLKGDRPGRYIANASGDIVEPPPGATDAFMGPYHVARGQLFIRERFSTEPAIDVEVLAHYIEMTSFPVPTSSYYARVGDFAGLVRAADLIGQLADPQYIVKLSRLYMEFCETGERERWGYKNAGELRTKYPTFFFECVRPYISEGLRFLRKTQDGQQWIANLYRHVHCEQHGEPSHGPEPAPIDMTKLDEQISFRHISLAGGAAFGSGNDDAIHAPVVGASD
jgi:hypothetical protein